MLLALAMCGIMSLLLYLLVSLPPTTSPNKPMITQNSTFAPKAPPRGFSHCDMFGFRGIVSLADGRGVEGVQAVVWADKTQVITLATSDVGGVYQIKLQPMTANLWLQLYAADRPISEAVPVELHADCHSGQQVYQIDWQENP